MKHKNKDYLGATLYALGFGLVSALIWFGVVVLTGYEIGFVAIAVGFLVGLGVTIGSGNKSGLDLQIMAGVFTLIAIMVGEYLIANHFIQQYLAEQSEVAISYFLNPSGVIEAIILMLKEDPYSLLFWGIAVFVGFGIPREKAQEPETPKTTNA